MIFTILYRPTGRTYYNRFVKRLDGFIWNKNSETVVDVIELSWTDSAVLMLEPGSVGQYPILVPTNLPTGVIYDVVVYRQLGGSPVNTDTIEIGFELKRGSSHGF